MRSAWLTPVSLHAQEEPKMQAVDTDSQQAKKKWNVSVSDNGSEENAGWEIRKVCGVS